MFPKRDPNRPGFLEQLNTKSKNFMDRTAEWAQGKNRSLEQKRAETFEAIARDMKNFREEDDWNTTPAAQPPVRSAEAPSGKRVRF